MPEGLRTIAFGFEVKQRVMQPGNRSPLVKPAEPQLGPVVRSAKRVSNQIARVIDAVRVRKVLHLQIDEVRQHRVLGIQHNTESDIRVPA